MINTLAMYRLTLLVIAAGVACANNAPRTGDELVSSVLRKCADMGCVKSEVLSYLDNILNLQSDTARSSQNVDAAIFKRAARVLQTHEFRFKMPEMFFDNTEIVYNPRSGLDVSMPEDEGRGLLKKKLLFPALLLLKLKMKALLPIFVGLIGIKALKALILSKLAIAIVLGFVIYQLVSKSGMPMAMNMLPMGPAPEPPAPVYGAPTPAPSSYEPGWEPSSASGPYSRVWTGGSSDSAQNLAYSAYYPGAASSSTSRP